LLNLIRNLIGNQIYCELNIFIGIELLEIEINEVKRTEIKIGNESKFDWKPILLSIEYFLSELVYFEVRKKDYKMQKKCKIESINNKME